MTAGLVVPVSLVLMSPSLPQQKTARNLHATIALLQAAKQTVARKTSGGINSRRNLPPVFPRAPSKLQSQGQQFRFNEVMSMLDCVFSHLPIGSYEWECIAAEHNENFPGKDQTGTSIWRKFAQLQKVKNPTGW